jgi:hypothetical protein
MEAGSVSALARPMRLFAPLPALVKSLPTGSAQAKLMPRLINVLITDHCAHKRWQISAK